MLLTHKPCDHALNTIVVCSECRIPVRAPDVEFQMIGKRNPESAALVAAG